MMLRGVVRVREGAEDVSRPGTAAPVDRLLPSRRSSVESVGGALEIQATPAAGTCVTVTVPTHLSESAPTEMSSV